MNMAGYRIKFCFATQCTLQVLWHISLLEKSRFLNESFLISKYFDFMVVWLPAYSYLSIAAPALH